MQRLSNIRKKDFLILFFIVLVGAFFRVWGLNKSGGLWFDELLTWNIAKDAFPVGILHRIMVSDFHFPLFYFVAHFWIKFFGDGDYVIRFLPCLFGILTIPAAFFAGRELNGSPCGIISALLVSINSFLIYYSQEFRFYSMLGFLGFLSIYFLLRFFKAPKKLNSTFLILINLCILYTNTIAFLFILVEFIVFGLYTVLRKRDLLKAFCANIFTTAVLFIPGIIMLFHAQKSVESSFIKPFSWWGSFDFTTVFMAFSNWFSPIFWDGYNNSIIFFKMIFSDFGLFLIIFIPVIIYLGLIIFGLLKDKFKTEKSFVSLVGLGLFLILTLLCFFDLFRLLPRYTVLCLPSLILFSAYAFTLIRNYRFKTCILLPLIIINILCFTDIKLSTPLSDRYSGILYVTPTLKKYRLSSKDVVFMGEGGKFLTKYFDINSKAVIPFAEFDAFVRGDRKALGLIMPPTLIKSLTVANSKILLKDYISTDAPSRELTSYINKKINFLHQGACFFVVAPHWTIDTYSYFKNNKFSFIQNQSLYNLLMIKIYNDVFNLANSNKKLLLREAVNYKYWDIFVFEKK